jgi:aldehyde:ferredoxin oxidoreductase
MFGWHGKILRINLELGRINTELLTEDLAKQFIGGRGLGVKLLYDELPGGIDPLSASNKLVFATGPLTGSGAPTAGRYCVISKSPLTGTIFDSHSGGFFGLELKRAGIDALVIEGMASAPTYIWLNNDSVELRDATLLWGLNTNKTTKSILDATDQKARVACIGPAGEKQARISCIINDEHRAAGRGGLGAVMGAKKLKAIVVRGDKRTELANESEFKLQVKKSLEVLRKHPITKTALPTLGTAALVNIINELGVFPTANHQQGIFNDADGISGEKLAERFLVQSYGCAACPIACGRKTETSKHSGGGPEYETIWALGAQCNVKDLEAITEANYLCNELGLDTISTGATIACAMELATKKLSHDFLAFANATSTKVEFGNAEALLNLVVQIGNRKGLGDELAEGSYRFAAKYGHPELSMSVKKLELPAYDPRGLQGMGLAYATSNRGGCHLRSYMVAPEVLGVPCKIDRFKTEGKAELVILLQNLFAVVDSLIFCKFTTFAWAPSHYTALLNFATGLTFSESELLEVGERIYNLERLFNFREGFTRADDTLPERLTTEPLATGHSKGRVVNLEPMLDEYYKLRGWSPIDGKPEAPILQKIGLDIL